MQYLNKKKTVHREESTVHSLKRKPMANIRHYGKVTCEAKISKYTNQVKNCNYSLAIGLQLYKRLVWSTELKRQFGPHKEIRVLTFREFFIRANPLRRFNVRNISSRTSSRWSNYPANIRFLTPGPRPADLGWVEVTEILRLHNDGGFLFNRIWGKTLWDGHKNVFGNPHITASPIQWRHWTVHAMRTFHSHWKLTSTHGSLFRSTTPKKGIKHSPFTSAVAVVSLAAVFSIVTQRSSPQTAAHIRTTFLSTTLTNHHVVYIFRELGAPK